MVKSKSVVVEVKDKPTSVSRLKRMIVSDVDRALLSEESKGVVYVTWQITSVKPGDAETVEVVKIGRSSNFLSTRNSEEESTEIGGKEEPPAPIGNTVEKERLEAEGESERRAEIEAEKRATETAYRDDLSEKTIVQLKRILAELELETDGNKGDLIDRLIEHESKVQD